MKRILVVYYSQTGQLERIVRSVVAPFERNAGVEVDFLQLVPAKPYPFPWPIVRFFDQFPECVRLDPAPLAPMALPPESIERGYDLIVLGYQPWYLSPSPPTTAFLQSPLAARLLKGKPVVTVIGCRNMWIMGQERIRQMLGAIGARLVDNIALIDGGSPFETFITTPVWLLTGRKHFWPGVFTAAGVAERDIQQAEAFGQQLVAGLIDGRLTRGESVLDAQTSCPVNPSYLVSEKMGWRSFWIWSWIVRLAGRQGSLLRVPLLTFYALFLGLAIALVVPLTLLARKLLGFVPAYRRWLSAQVNYYQYPPKTAVTASR
jgi:hypothetical protein